MKIKHVIGTGVAAAALMVSGAASAFSCADATFRDLPADDCYLVDGNPDTNDNDSASAMDGLFGPTWFQLDKTDEASRTVFGVTWTLTAVVGQTGTWELSWVDAGGSPGLPLLMDLVFAVKAAGDYGAWLFEEEIFAVSPSSGSGTYTITWLNKGQEIPNLSHATVYGRNGREYDVPEPGSLALLGLGLIGLGVSRRRFTK